uniref:Ig-like domain-containing protein n=1 Tax=Cyprinodon variegatus TaxID=28743 RepID=A0A3Q2CQR8_CYPVA
VSSGVCSTPKVRSVLTVSPSWLSPGDSVNLSCKVDPPSTGWRLYWYEALLANSVNGTVEDSFIIHGQRDTAGYACRAGRGNREDFTDYSEPEFVWSADPHPAVSLTVSPDREQHFTSESVTVNCRENSAERRVRILTAHWSNVSYCTEWGEMNAPTCNISIDWPYKALYWCELESVQFSNPVNITVENGDLLLVSTIHPVTEGASVTLSCRLRGQNTLSSVFFYHNDKLVQNDSRGELKISTVSQSDKGFYKCEHSGKASPQSWMAVKGEQIIGGVLIIFLLLVCCLRPYKGDTFSFFHLY